MVLHTYYIWLLGGVLAAVTSGLLLLSTRYPRTKRFVLTIPSFWGYVFGHFLLGTTVLSVISLTPVGSRPTVVFIPSWIFWPVAVGLMGVLAKTSLVGAMPGAEHFHVTVRACLFLFEPGLLQQVCNDEYYALRAAIRTQASRWRDLKSVKIAIRANLPDYLDKKNRAFIEQELEDKDTVEGAMCFFWRLVGKRGFLFVFGEQKLSLVQTSLFETLEERVA